MAWCPELMSKRCPGKLPAFVREFLFVSLFRVCAQSLASENAARLEAMQRTKKIIDQMLLRLRRSFQRLRQERIDEELFDLVSGFEALQLSQPHTEGQP